MRKIKINHVILAVMLVMPFHGIISQIRNGKMISIQSKPAQNYFCPLDEISIAVSNAKGNVIAVWDGKSDEYFRTPAAANNTFLIGGAIGSQTICLFDKKGLLIDKASFDVNCKTEIRDENDFYNKILKMLHHSMMADTWGVGHGGGSETEVVRINDKFYRYFVGWLRDHVHTMKGMKYFYPELKSAIDLYSDTQREDGMVFDNIGKLGKKSYWEIRFTYGGFYKPIENSDFTMLRIPVEADVEYLYIEGLYYTWKATGDNLWMASRLDNALKALKYCTSDPYRWSQKYQLIKRGYTIDTWDFQNEEDSRISAGPGNPPDVMAVKLGNTRFNVMHGDNTGIAVGCNYLAEMLDFVGRKEEASKTRAQGKQILDNLYSVSWNGEFFTHQVPEDPSIKRDLGVDEKTQVSLSNSYDLNRNIDHDKCVEIIKTYQRIRQEMPKTSPGEFYGIYPPFKKGYGQHSEWEYVNGGVTAMVAGELAHGAFENGYEKYGVDIIQRMYDLSKRTDEYIQDTYRGSMPEDPIRHFTPVDLKPFANVDFDGTKGSKGVPAWTGEGVNDLHNCPVGSQVYEKIPFVITDPAANGRKACIGLSGAKGYKLNTVIPVNAKTASVYLLHTLCVSSGVSSTNAGSVVFNYTDNTKAIEVIDYQKIANWWYPARTKMAKIAFTVANDKSTSVGAYLCGLNNPNPDKTIKTIELQGIDINSKWMILGITLCDYPVYFTPSFISYGMPTRWCCAALVYAMVEGLAGVKDNGVCYDKVLFAPRWSASDVKKVKTTIKYEASGGYVAYDYNATATQINIIYTSNSTQTDVRILLPEGKKSASVMVGGVNTAFKTESVEQSNYAVFSVAGKGVSKISCNLQ